MQAMGRCHQSGRYKEAGWFLLLLLWQLCPFVLAAQKNVECLPVGTATSSEYAAFLKQARFTPSSKQQQEVERLFAQLKERHITIKPSLCKLLSLADNAQLVPLCQKTALFFSNVDNSCIKNSGCLSSMMQTKKHIRDFIGQEDVGIAIVAAAPYLSSVTSMCNKNGVPDGETVNNLLSWPCWQVNGGLASSVFVRFPPCFMAKGSPKRAVLRPSCRGQFGR